MKKGILFLFFIFLRLGLLEAQSCLVEGISFYSQEDIDNFPLDYPNCTHLLGDILIKDNLEGSPITNLNGLNQISIIDGDLTIDENTSLTSLGFQNLISIGGFFFIKNNSVLPNLNSLENLTAVGATLLIRENEALESISGLEDLIMIGFDLKIQVNPLLTNLNGLEDLETIGGYLGIQNNATLANINGLESLTSIGEFAIIQGNPILSNLNGLENLTVLGQSLTISTNPNLSNLNGLIGLSHIEENLSITNNALLANLTGLENLTTIVGNLHIQSNDIMTNLNGIDHLNLIGEELQIFDNPFLSICDEPSICNHLQNGGSYFIDNNSTGCENVVEVLSSCIGDFTLLSGQILADFDSNCEASNEDEGVPWLINIANDNYSVIISTDNEGNYSIPVFESDWIVNPIAPSTFWTSCFVDTLISTYDILGEIVNTDFYMQAAGDCAFIDWDLTMSPLHICDTNTIVIDFCNYGVFTAEDVIIELSLDPFLNIIDAEYPFTTNEDGLISFEIGMVDIFDCQQFSIDAFVDCDSLELGELQCIQAAIISDELCAPNPSEWDGSTVVVNGFCENDSIHFELKNIGAGNMSEETQFKVDILIDDIVLLQEVDDFQLIAEETKVLSYEIDNMSLGMRLAADQTTGHPVNEEASVVVPNCDDIANNIIFTLLPSNNGDPFMETFCNPVVGSFDPNIKTAIPVGTNDNHEIEKEWQLDYLIQFQNTGNAAADLVVLKDTLSENLDLTTLRISGASHDFTWSLNPERELVFTFENINLPDSTTNEPASHGFVHFKINPSPDILPGEIIENRVGIYFDTNDPILTNIVFHTIKKPIVATSEHLNWCAGDVYEGEEIWENKTIQIETEFAKYDSIHFLHFDVIPQAQEDIVIDILVGEYFQDILIEEDTSFTLTYTTQNNCDSLVTYTVSAITSVDEISTIFKTVNISPNPTYDFFRVSNHTNNEPQEWQLLNPIGKPIWMKKLAANELLPKISLNIFPSGIYFLKVKTESATAVWKVIKR